MAKKRRKAAKTAAKSRKASSKKSSKKMSVKRSAKPSAKRIGEARGTAYSGTPAHCAASRAGRGTGAALAGGHQDGADAPARRRATSLVADGGSGNWKIGGVEDSQIVVGLQTEGFSESVIVNRQSGNIPAIFNRQSSNSHLRSTGEPSSPKRVPRSRRSTSP